MFEKKSETKLEFQKLLSCLYIEYFFFIFFKFINYLRYEIYEYPFLFRVFGSILIRNFNKF